MALDDTALLDADRRARHAALDVRRSFIVQAPAGSGKTELLIQRYLRLLATVTEPEEILAITFTRKAAAEMRLRVVEALEGAQSGRRHEQAHRRITADAAAAALSRDRENAWGLVENPGRLRILTIDALNAAIARMLPITSGSGGGATIAEDNEMLAIYRQAAAATLDWLGSDDDTGRSVREVLEHMDANTTTYVEQLATMLARRDQWLPFVRSGRIAEFESARLRQAFERHLREIGQRHIAAAIRLLPRDLGAQLPALAAYCAANLLAGGGESRPLHGFAEDASLPGDDAGQLPRWHALADFLLTGDDRLRRTVDVRHGFPPSDDGQKAAMLSLLARLSDHPRFLAALVDLRHLPAPRYADEQWHVLLSLFRLLPVATYELRRICLARGITDHIEVAISAADALGTADEPGSVALLMDYTVRHILVDEMQDTSKAQYRLLESLTAGWEADDGRTLFCVGDPMQSIYRFRNAEVMQFLAARERGIGTIRPESLVLRQNFRSGERLVHWFNDTFAKVLPAQDDPQSGAVAYTPAVPAPELQGKGCCVLHPGFGSSVESEARCGAELIRQLVRDNAGDTVAVLVRSRTQLPALLRQLRTLGVASQSVDIDRLTDLPEVLDILTLTRALVHQGDRVAWLGMLRSPWIGLDWADLHALVCDAADATVLELLHDPARLAGLSAAGRDAVARTLPVIESALHAGGTESLRRRVECCWFRLGGPALMPDADAVDNVYRYLDTLAKLETSGTLADVAELYAQLDAERVTASSDARVQIMTMHKAKGLQFDHVILYATGRRSASNRASIMSWIDLPGSGDVENKLVSPIGRRDELEKDPLHRYIEKSQAEKDAQETRRLLYVACTRARKSLHIVGQVGLAAGGDAYKEPWAGTLLRLLWPVVEPVFAAAFAERAPQVPADREATFVHPPFRRFAEPWHAPVVAPPVGRPDEQADRTDDPRVEYDWVGFDARLAGTVVHRWLQRLVNQTGPGVLPAGFDDVSTRWLLELGAPAAQCGSIVARVRAAVEGTLGDERGRWLLAGRGAVELALTGHYGSRLESIVIDRVLVDDDGTHWIVDYKTSSHEGGDLDGFLRAESERYRAQLDRYSTIYASYVKAPVRRALYFPLLRRFVEVEPG